MCSRSGIAVAVFGATAGTGGSDLGSDQRELVVLAWCPVDLTTGMIGKPKCQLVCPENLMLIENCTSQIGLTSELLVTAPPYDDVVHQLAHCGIEWSFENGFGLHKSMDTIQSETSGAVSIQLVTDGPQLLRQVIHPEARRKLVVLPDCFYSFIDLQNVFATCCGSAGDDPKGVVDMEAYFHLQREDLPFGLSEVKAMAKIIVILISEPNNCNFLEIDHVMRAYEGGLSYSTEPFVSGTVVRVRGLPWQASDQDIANFFAGLNITRAGIAMCLNAYGRRNGEALVRFVDKVQRNLALARNKHYMGSRYLEIYKGTSEEFTKIAGVSDEVVDFVNTGARAIIRIRGLPFSTTAEQVVSFFNSNSAFEPLFGLENEGSSATRKEMKVGPTRVTIADGAAGVLLVKHSDGQPTGDAFVLLASEEESQKALTWHGHSLGRRYVEIFPSTTAEVQQVINHYQVTPSSQSPPPLHAFGSRAKGSRGFEVSGRDCLRLRGLPYSALVHEIVAFLGDSAADVKSKGVHLILNHQGLPSGDAFIQMKSAEAAMRAAQRCHKLSLGERYVEVFPCSTAEMAMVLLGGSLNRSGLCPPPCLCSPFFPIPPPAMFPPQMFVAPRIPPMVPPVPTSLLYNPAVAVNHMFMNCGAYQPSPSCFQMCGLPGGLGGLSGLGRPPSSTTVVRVQGLPYNVRIKDVISFFDGYQLCADSVLLLHDLNGQPSGEAFVTFSSPELASQAVLEKHHHHLADRPISLTLV
uniref:epithelial splicing regulatory protein 2-like n=1 Tax=Myxine glutinosa TaxID=7769 RepID=UPI00358EA02D